MAVATGLEKNAAANKSSATSPAAIAAAEANAAARKAANAALPAQQATLSANNLKAIQPEVNAVISDLNSNNFAGAWSTALSTSSLYDKNAAGDYIDTATTTDPLLQDLESSQGLEALDPTKQWNDQEINQYYDALGANPVYNGKTVDGMGGGAESLFKDPYGNWGSGVDLTNGTDAAANEKQSPNGAPNVEQFAGAVPTQSFMGKYGTDIALLAAAVAAPYAVPALAAAAGAGTGALALAGAGAVYGAGTTAAIDASTGKPVTLGGEASAALGGAVGAGLVPGAGGALNSATGIGSTASDALVGAGVGAARSGLSGGNIGLGALGGGIGGAIQGSQLGQQSSQYLQGQGVNSTLASGLARAGIATGTGALLGGLAGGGAGAAAGAEHGALSAGTGAVSGSILGAGNTIFSSGQAAQPTQDTNLTSPQAPGNMSYDFTGYDNYATGNNDPLSLGSIIGSTQPGEDPMSGLDPYQINGTAANGQIDTSALQAYINSGGGSSGGGNSFSLGGGGSNGSALGSLASLLGGSTGLSPSLLSQLLGAGSSYAGGLLNSNAAKSAATTYQQEGMYKPYGTSTTDGSTSFQNGQLQSSLSPGAQQNVNGLNSLAQQNMSSLAGGTAGAANSYYNQLQQQQKLGNSQYMGANLDNQFANGILSSTAGQYQTGAALNNLNQTNMSDETQAQNFANTQQQNQLSQLTSSLNGLQGYNTQQLQAGSLGATLGTGQSNANNVADQPWLAANSGSNIGNLLTSLGSSASSPYQSSGGY